MAVPDRRRFLLGAGVAALAAGCTAGRAVPDGATSGATGSGAAASGTAASRGAASGAVASAVVDPLGERQAGVDRPAVPQDRVRVAVFDAERDALAALLSDLRATAVALAEGTHPALAGMGPARLTTTVGLGPAAVTLLGAGPAGAEDLPVFPGDAIDPAATGGDVLLQLCADDPLVVTLAAAALRAAAGDRLRPRWSQDGFRGGSAPDGSTRNLLGFGDGIVVPRGEEELRREVWRDGDATIAVVRRLRLDLDAFAALPLPAQEAAVGRRRGTGEPLSGGGPGAQVNLNAKSPDGEFLLPVDSHARRAHPATTGSGLMLRRGYAYDNGDSDAGQLFVCFQRELRTFVATQFRLAESDALLRYATTTASGTFLILPGAPSR